MKRSLSISMSATVVALLSLYPAAADDRGPAYGQESVTPLATPVGQTIRYLVTDFSSIVGAGTYANTASVVTVFNSSTKPCSVSVDWFLGHAGSACTTNYANLPAGQTAVFCTRSTSPNVTACDVVCSAELNFHQGFARVASTTGAVCARIAVAARIYYLDSADNQVMGITDARVVKKGLGNSGD